MPSTDNLNLKQIDVAWIQGRIITSLDGMQFAINSK